MADKEKKGAIINISKALATVSFAVIAAIGAASGSMVFAGLAAIPAAALAGSDTIGSLLVRFKLRQDEFLELPVPPWWRSDFSFWQGLCVEIEEHLPSIMLSMAKRLQQEQGVVTNQVVIQVFIDAVENMPSRWEFDPKERRKVGEYIAAPFLQKMSDVLRPIVSTLQQEHFLLDTHSTSLSSAEQVALSQELVKAMKQAVDVLEKIREEVRKPDERTIAQSNADASSSVVLTNSTIASTPAIIDSAPSGVDIVSVLQAKITANNFDVFLSYNSKDRQAVEKIAVQLKEHGILPWFDKWELIPGRSWQQALAKQIQKTKAAAVFVGISGMGPWHQIEMEALLRQFARRNCPVIPVLLPVAPHDQEPELPLFLGNIDWVDFREKDPDPLQQLIRGITQGP